MALGRATGRVGGSSVQVSLNGWPWRWPWGWGSLGSAGAHHSFAVFFNTDAQLVKITGVVRDFQFRNPHGVITLAVTKGKDQITWRAETNSPSVLRRRGWTPGQPACRG